MFFPPLESYLKSAIHEFGHICEERKTELAEISRFIKDKVQNKEPIQLTFICTHNSRRSHISQIWAQTAATYYGISNVQTYSGGTEATAFNPRAVAAIQRAGFQVVQTTETKNPIYHIHFSDNAVPMTAISKVYNYAPNPAENYCAVMTCSSADQACPIVTGAAHRVSVPYEDPKIADNTPEETGKYDERCRQICREMMYAFSLVKE